MRIVGLDLGSREVKLAVWEDDRLVRTDQYSTMSFYRDYCTWEDQVVVQLDKLGIEDFDLGISTGYGRNNTNLLGFEAINEIKAHAYGAMHQTGDKDFILLDVGGQDVKVIRVEKGLVTDLDLNEKCAASCGRYLENMAAVLELPLDDLSTYSKDPVELNATCAVFSESELIGKIAEGASVASLCAGVNWSMYQRLKPMLTKFRGQKLVVSGGVAKNQAILGYLKESYPMVEAVASPQFNGAIGCCIYGRKKGRDHV